MSRGICSQTGFTLERLNVPLLLALELGPRSKQATDWQRDQATKTCANVTVRHARVSVKKGINQASIKHQ
eukprot:363128-Chlamydomonas_euryale.AAC.2